MSPSPHRVVPLSAHTEADLHERATALLGRVQAGGTLDAVAAEPSASDPGPARAALVVDSDEALERALLELLAGKRSQRVVRGRAGAHTVAWLFTGQGSQYAGMGRHLYASEPVFRDALDAAAAALDPHLPHPLLSVLWPDNAPDPSAVAGLLDDTTYTQPGLFALQVALAQLLRSRGLEPDLVLGHSIGELSAAWVAGVLSLEDAAGLVARRGGLMGALPHGGAMANVQASEAEVVAALQGHEARVSVAALNAPGMTVLSGEQAGVDAVVDALGPAAGRVRALTVSHAFHSPLMDPILEPLTQAAAALPHHPPRVRLVSTLTGRLAGPDDLQGAYWARHARGAVRYQDALLHAASQGVDLAVELGPTPVLSKLAKRIVPAQQPFEGIETLRKGRDDGKQLALALARLWVAGQPVRFSGA